MRLKRSNIGAYALVSLAVLSVMALSAAPALALPEGRHYEMVSPPSKGGYGVFNLVATAMTGEREGEGVVFNSLGHFDGQPEGFIGPYLARRGDTGWTTSPLLPPLDVAGEDALNDISPTLQGLYEGQQGPNQLAAEQEGNGEFFYHDLYAPDRADQFLGPFTETPLGVPLERLDGKPFILQGSRGSDPGFCHVIFGLSTSGALLPEAPPTGNQLYELLTGAPGCEAQRTLRLVAVENEVGPNDQPKLLDPSCAPGFTFALNPVAAEGSEIFFTTPTHPGCAAAGNPAMLFVRLNGEKTVEISRPLPADCTSGPCVGAEPQSAELVGADEAGTRVFFTTSQPLVSGDTDTGRDLYLAEVGCPPAEPACEPAEREVTGLTQVSHDANLGEGAEVQGNPWLSADGARTYFVAQGVLSGANREGRSPTGGADNLYVYDSELHNVHFIADLCSGPGQSAHAIAPSCPNTLNSLVGGRNDTPLWTESSQPAQMTHDGRFLVFPTYAKLTADDTDNGRDVYRYDAVAETLDRVSLGEDGYDTNGNGNGENFDAEIVARRKEDVSQTYELGTRAITEDGSRVVFETTEPLSPQVDNHGLVNAYEWHKEPGWPEGHVSLVSNGHDEEAVGADLEGQPGEVMITPSGRDIFFTTVQGLSAEDTDGAMDVYDARLGPGFPARPSSPRQCEGEACQGSLTNPLPVLVPGSASQAPGENLGPSAPRAAAAPSRKMARRCAKGKRVRHGKCVKRRQGRTRRATRSTNATGVHGRRG